MAKRIYRTRVILQRAVEASDGAGGQVRTWVEIARPWTSARPSGGTTAQIAEALQSRQSWAIWVRFRKTVEKNAIPGDRIVLGGDNLIVRGVSDPEQKRAELLLACEKEVPEHG